MDYNSQFTKNAARFRSKIAFDFPDRGVTLSHIDIRDYSHRLACYLLHLGIRKGDYVCLWMGNVPEHPLISAACLRIGAIVVPLNIYESAENICSMCRECGGKILFLDGSNKYIRRQLTHTMPDSLPVVNIADFEDERSLRLNFIPADLPLQKICCTLQGSDPAFLLYTSGSTGEKKAVLKSLNSLSSLSTSIRLLLSFFHRFICPLNCFVLSPWYHLAGMSQLFWIFDGTQASLISLDRFNPRSVAKHLQEQRVALWIGTATMLSRCCAQADASLQLPSIVLTSGEALSRRVLEVLESRSGCQAIFSVYGTTEIGGVTLMPYFFPHTTRIFHMIGHFLACFGFTKRMYRYEDFPANAQALLLGDIVSDAQVIIYDEERDCILPDGESGEIFVHTHTAIKRYEHSAENNLCIELDGKHFVRTGDLGFKRGSQLYLIGRKKNLIIRSGENIIPAEIEQAAACYPGVLAAVACGIPSSTHGEDICLCLETDGSFLDIPALSAHLESTLPKYMIPQHIEIFEEFPIGNTGKVNVQAIQKKMALKYPAA